MNICVSYVYGENYSELAAICKPSLILYCAKWGYACDMKQIKPNEKGTYAYARIEHTAKLLEEYDCVLMLEGDMLITNDTYRIEGFLQTDKHFYLTKDINGVNTASFIVVKSEASKELLHNCLLNKDKYPDEQNFFEKLDIDIIKELPHPSINSLPYEYYAPSYGKYNYKDGDVVEKPTHEQGCWQQGDFVMHLPGFTLEQRIKIFNLYK